MTRSTRGALALVVAPVLTAASLASTGADASRPLVAARALLAGRAAPPLPGQMRRRRRAARTLRPIGEEAR